MALIGMIHGRARMWGSGLARDTGGAIKGNKIDVLTSSNSESNAITGNYNVYLAE